VSNIAEISVIVTGTVALGTPLINAWLTALQSGRAARSERLDELRSVIDIAAVSLIMFMEAVPTDLRRRDGSVNVEAIEASLGPMQEALQAVWRQEDGWRPGSVSRAPSMRPTGLRTTR
jgi:hypothetical protein